MQLLFFIIGILLAAGAVALLICAVLRAVRARRLPWRDMLFSLAIAACAGLVAILLISPQADAWREARQPLYTDTLRYAAMTKDVEAVRTMLEAGRSPDESYDPDGWTPLICAAQSFSEYDDPAAAAEITRLLLAAGAKTDRTDSYGYTALLFASQVPSHAEVLSLLLGAGADPDVCVGTLTPLRAACLQGATESVTLLLAAGARVDGDRNPLPDAVYPDGFAKYEIVRALLTAGADPGATVLFEGENGETETYTLTEAVQMDRDDYIAAGCPPFDFGADTDGYEDNYQRIFALLAP